MLGRDDFGLRLAVDLAEVIPPRAGGRIGPPFHPGPIQLLHRAKLELPGQTLGGAAAGGKDNRPRGRPVEPVRNAEIHLARPLGPPGEKRLDADLQAVDARRGLRGQPRRLAHHQARPVVVEYLNSGFHERTRHAPRDEGASRGA